MKKKLQTNELKIKAEWVWKETLKIHHDSPETRVASSLSPIEILVALYYGGVVDIFPKQPLSPNRDRIIISKGHGSLCMYPILADLGFFKKKELKNVCKSGSFLGGIPDPIIPGYETINGSLGHGVGVGTGIALALRKKRSNKKVFVLTGDGELHEGSNWEAFMLASQLRLDNLIVLVDNNKISMLDHTDNIVSHRNLYEKMHTFGWKPYDVKDGHNVSLNLKALNLALKNKEKKPKIIIFNTNKGNKVPDLQNLSLSHVIAIKPETIKSLLK